jgi:biopolymer transport protein ExbB
MLSSLFLGLSLLGAEWVLYFLVLLSIASVTLMVERARFYRDSTRNLEEFRNQVRTAGKTGKWEEVKRLADTRLKSLGGTGALDLETAMVAALIEKKNAGGTHEVDVLTEVAQDSVLRAKLAWEKNLAALATIGNNAPFVGLFGTVLGIIKAFHDLSQQSAQGVQTVTAGVSEALVATAVGILVAIPAVIAFNFFQRRVKAALGEAESLKSFLIGSLVNGR